MPLKALAITSSGPGEGKTTTISNLAITFAQTGSKVLLVDGDLRKPSIHKLYGLTNSTGLVNILAKQVSLSSCIQGTLVENLFVLTSGPTPPNPSELLQSDSMRKFVNEVYGIFDVILIDTPPVCNVTDAAILSSLVDGIILVAASGKVKIEELKRAKDILDKVNANIIGVVLNKLDKNSNRSYYNNYYNYVDNTKTTDKRRKRKKEHIKTDNATDSSLRPE
jgi:capsular exopolysaccharide synthesis family protein